MAVAVARERGELQTPTAELGPEECKLRLRHLSAQINTPQLLKCQASAARHGALTMTSAQADFASVPCSTADAEKDRNVSTAKLHAT